MKTERMTEIPATLTATSFRVGDIISFDLTDGEPVKAMAVKRETDGTIFCHVDCLAKEHRMNSRATNKGAYEASDLRKKLNGEIINRYPQELRDAMKPFPNGDLLRIPTEKEIFGENYVGEPEDDSVQQWEPMKLRRNRIAFQGDNGSWEWYWLQNPASAAAFAGCYSLGDAYCSGASSSRGVRPAFKIG